MSITYKMFKTPVERQWNPYYSVCNVAKIANVARSSDFSPKTWLEAMESNPMQLEKKLLLSVWPAPDSRRVSNPNSGFVWSFQNWCLRFTRHWSKRRQHEPVQNKTYTNLRLRSVSLNHKTDQSPENFQLIQANNSTCRSDSLKNNL